MNPMENATIPVSPELRALATLSAKARELEALAPGCYVDGSAGPDEFLSRRIIEFAESYGFQAGDLESLLDRCDDTCAECWDAREGLSELSDDALDYLNELDSTPYAHWVIEDASLFKLASVEDASQDAASWKHGTDVIPESELPEFVLSVNDHGNATLYRIELVPVWSVV